MIVGVVASFINVKYDLPFVKVIGPKTEVAEDANPALGGIKATVEEDTVVPRLTHVPFSESDWATITYLVCKLALKESFGLKVTLTLGVVPRIGLTPDPTKVETVAGTFVSESN